MTYQDFIEFHKIRDKHKEMVSSWFPVYPSEDIAQIFAALLTDGHIDWNDYDGNPMTKKIILYSNYKNECQWFLEKIYDLFHINGKVVKYRSTSGFSRKESFKAIVYCAPLARLLISLGVPCGDKTTKNYLVPEWIILGTKEIKSSFLKVLFSFDGSISIRHTRSTAEINFCFNKHNNCFSSGQTFMFQIKQLLNDFGVSSGNIHIRKTKYAKYPDYDKSIFMLFISNHSGIIHFYTNIGFLNRKKHGKLQKFIYKIYQRARIPFKLLPNILIELKEQIGTDKETVDEINKYSKIPFTYRQFEHIRRGELKSPLQMVIATLKILNKKEYFGVIPEYYQCVVNIYDSFFLQ
ncbi:MAG: hypothetical protein ABII22_00220 [Candidatus Micrarchaeota archaeon]